MRTEPRLRRRALVSALAVLALGVAPAGAALTTRTERVSAPGGESLDGPVTDAVLSGNAVAAVFTTTATDALGLPREARTPAVVWANLLDGRRRLVSATVDGSPADGPSGDPSVSGAGLVVAFTSGATNLVADDSNGTGDVFVRRGEEPVELVSVAEDGGPANAPSLQPDVSADGRYVAFTSLASNLVPGDTAGYADVFIRDLVTQTTRRVSRSTAGGEGHGRSSAPAISADGAVVAFESAAPDLVDRDTNGAADVFVRVLRTGKTERVSRSSTGVQQDRGIAAPFTAAPDISGDGRYVVFDSEARTLYSRDLNRRSDIFLHDRRRGTTTLVSANSFNVQGDNDSVTPRISPNARFVTFQSFAGNLVQDDGPGPDLFVRNLRNDTTSLIGVGDSGARRGGEPGGPLLQRGQISDDGRVALFASAAEGLVDGRSAGIAQLYVRRLRAASVSVAGKVTRSRRQVSVRVRADDPRATRLLCRIDRAVPYPCKSPITTLRASGSVLTIRAGGPGLLWSAAVTVRLTGT